MKKKILIVLSLLVFSVFLGINSLTSAADATTIYVGPNGQQSNAGTKESPWDLVTAKSKAKPGTTIIMLDGTYEYSSRVMILPSESGTYNAPITVKAEDGARVVLDFSAMAFNGNNRGIQLNGNWWHFYGIEITGAGDNGMYVGGSNNVIENCLFYKNRDTGLQLGRASGSDSNINVWPSNNLIKNCTSFYNYDDETLGENADGFGAKLTIGYGNVFDGCIAYRNSDDGWDLYAKEDSGNIGTVTLYNCLSFENGFLPEEVELPNGAKSYNTTNGDGIGFKLGGGVMEGDVILENCIAFNNKLHGFSDNSNPGFIQLRNCTAVNNCIGLNADGTVALRGIPGGENKSNNFDLSRDTNSYNSYYGLLSFINNQEGFDATGNSSYNKDKFRGSTAYSIFQTEYAEGREVYMAAKDFVDVSSYSGDVLPMLTEQYEGLSEDSFVSIESVNAIGDKLYKIHELLRNDDNSINFGDTLKIVDEELLKFVDGKPIGADLSKTSWDEYNHPVKADYSKVTSDAKLKLQLAYDALSVATNVDAVYQNFEIAKYLNSCEIEWSSSNEELLVIDTAEEISRSSSVYVVAKVFTPLEDTQVTLTAKIIYGSESLEKTFELTIKARSVKLGNIISSSSTDNYVLNRYQRFTEPTIIVTDGSSVDNAELNPSLYTITKKYEWAETRNHTYIELDGIYTSVPGVFRVTYTATLKTDTSQFKTYTYYISIGKDECEIDFIGGINTFKLNSIGFNISGTTSNPTGKIYAVVVPNNVSLYEASEIVSHADVQVFSFTTSVISFDFEADNSSLDGYKVYYVIGDKVGRNFSNPYSKQIVSKTVSTQEEFYKLAQGLTDSDSLTIYNLTQDLDFSEFTWVDPEKDVSPFKGTFNGNGHTISNVTVKVATQKNANLFYKLQNGTVMNVNFEEIIIEHIGEAVGAKQIGIIGAMEGGYVSDINMKNVSVTAPSKDATAVGALIGQVTGGVNRISYITLKNDENHELYAGNKYVGGIVGNIQMDSGNNDAKVYVSYCIVVADLGNGEDAGGCVSGIVGRIKNDKTEYYLDVTNCYYKGTIEVKGNYNAGIVGSIEAGNGKYNISNNFADVIFIYCNVGRTVLDAREVDTSDEYQKYAHKNCNPICGRATTLYDEVLGRQNAGSWAEYYDSTILSTSMYFLYGPDFVPSAGFFKSFCDWDVENIWNVDASGNVSFR